MAVVKSNAYGHGLIEVASVAKSHADWFGVDSLDEALKLRKEGIEQPILVLGYIPFERIPEAIGQRIAFMLYSQEMLEWLQAHPQKQAFSVHLELETGLTRQGISLEQLQHFTTQAVAIFGLNLEGVATHFADVEEASGQAYVSLQLERFKQGIEIIKACGAHPTIIHAACSAATVMRSDANFSLVRLGIGQYGLWSSDEMRLKVEGDFYLEPVLTWKTRIAQVKSVQKGTPVSYGMTETVTRDSLIGVLPVGYWDGFDRVGNSSKGIVLVNGVRCKIVGRICMNMCMVDLTDAGVVRVGDEAVLIGSEAGQRVSAEDLAARSETINYEVVTRINPLIPRVLVS